MCFGIFMYLCIKYQVLFNPDNHHIHKMKRTNLPLLAFLLAVLCFQTSCKKEDQPDPEPTPLPMSKAYVTDSLRVETDKMTVYNFVYPSVDPYGNPVMLSGSITLGDSVTRHKPALGMILYNHFTVYRADQCPTQGELSVQQMLAHSKMITVSPDYYGFGVTGAKHQAYCLSRVNAQGSVDALLAARTLLTEMGYSWDDHLFNTGYSQGGQTAMGVVRLVAESYPDIHITCTFAGAGSYDIPATYRQFIIDSIAGMPSTVISVMLAYNEFMNLGITREEMFLEPVLSHIDEWLLSKCYTREEIDAMVGSLRVTDYVTPTLLDLQSEPSQRFLTAMEHDNLCQGWTPRSDEPIYLFHNTQDITVPVVNTEHLYQYLTTHGATQVTLDVDDYGCSTFVPAHETGAASFQQHSFAVMCQMLGIDHWSVY